MPYTQHSMENLVREGIERERVFVTGNPIYEVLRGPHGGRRRRDILERYRVSERVLSRHPAPIGKRRQWRPGSIACCWDCSRSRRRGTADAGQSSSAHRQPHEGLRRQRLRINRCGCCHRWGSSISSPLKRTRGGSFRQRNRAGGVRHLRRPERHAPGRTERPETLEAGSNILAGSCRTIRPRPRRGHRARR